MLTRRHLLGTSALAAAAALAHPRRALAGTEVPERKFLFLLATGGWDPTYVFAPSSDKPYVDTESDATVAEAHGVRFVDHAARPSVRAFFEAWGDQACVLNGFEVQSITHDRCMRLLLTGEGGNGIDDWGSILASHSRNDLMLPYLVLGGRSFTARHVSEVVRAGRTGQLAELLAMEGYLPRSEGAVPLPAVADEARVRAYLQDRAARLLSEASPGHAERYATLYGRTLDQVERLVALGDTLGIGETPATTLDAWGDLATAVGAFQMGLARCAMVSYDGLWSMSWDSHSGIEMQSQHFEGLFQHLSPLMELLATTLGTAGTPLLDEVTVVVLSEMGRGPMLNTWGGKDHFTFTSAMLLGSGIRGGQVIGGADDYGLGRPVDLATGEVTDTGTALRAAHLGATLLALGDVDPAQEIDDAAPIAAILA
jgi:uncharacterized protein (DUF1501 family)